MLTLLDDAIGLSLEHEFLALLKVLCQHPAAEGLRNIERVSLLFLAISEQIDDKVEVVMANRDDAFWGIDRPIAPVRCARQNTTCVLFLSHINSARMDL